MRKEAITTLLCLLTKENSPKQFKIPILTIGLKNVDEN
jgi:hypothetical protein